MTGQEENASSCARMVWIGYLRKFLQQRGCQALQQSPSLERFKRHVDVALGDVPVVTLQCWGNSWNQGGWKCFPALMINVVRPAEHFLLSKYLGILEQVTAWGKIRVGPQLSLLGCAWLQRRGAPVLKHSLAQWCWLEENWSHPQHPREPRC